MRISVPHRLGKDAARARVEELLPRALELAGGQVTDLRHEWDGDTLRFSLRALRTSLKGTLQVSEDRAVFDMQLPLLARAFEGGFQTRIMERLGRLLS